MGYNTAVSTLMILTNQFEDCPSITKEEYHVLLTLLNPIAPHITEELNESIGYKPICESSWPIYDESKTIDNEKNIAVQVNGKVRGTILITNEESEDSIKKKALDETNVKKYIENKEIIKTIVIPNKIVNIVVKDKN